ncbi:hypothetical protein ACOMHN_002462 [Nucella lapillus]
MDGSLFDLRRLRAKTKTIGNLSWRLSLPTTVLSWHTRNLPSSSLSTSLLKHPACSDSPSVLAKQKCCSSPALSQQAASISIEGTELKTVEEFKYLDSVISSDGSLDKEINARICKASQALGRLRARVLNQHNIQQSTKLKVYKTIVLTSLLYGFETWTL